VEVVFELDVDQLVGSPEFRIDRVEELNDLLIEFSLRNFWSFNEKGNPIVTTIAIDISSQEIVSVDKVFSALVYINHYIDLTSSIDVILWNSLIDQSHISSCFVKCRVS